MLISKWRPPLAAILKTYNRNIFKGKYPIFMQFASKRSALQILKTKIQVYFCDPFPLKYQMFNKNEHNHVPLLDRSTSFMNDIAVSKDGVI